MRLIAADSTQKSRYKYKPTTLEYFFVTINHKFGRFFNAQILGEFGRYFLIRLNRQNMSGGIKMLNSYTFFAQTRLLGSTCVRFTLS
jgi:hypothetical protein